jgi:large subunit ribosomal protein L6
MSRVAKNPIAIPSGVDINLQGGVVTAKGPNGQLEFQVHPLVNVAQEEGRWTFAGADESKKADALAGTTRAIINNMVTGVSQGFERKLTIVGVGYRAQAKGKELQLNLGFSHPVNYPVPEGITIETPSQTEVVVKGADKQKVGQVAAEIRRYRPPEPYKGKGVRYADEYVMRKQAKKK